MYTAQKCNEQLQAYIEQFIGKSTRKSFLHVIVTVDRKKGLHEYLDANWVEDWSG